MAKTTPLVSCAHVKKSFLDGAQQIDVLKDVDLSVERGEIISIIGQVAVEKQPCLTS